MTTTTTRCECCDDAPISPLAAEHGYALCDTCVTSPICDTCGRESAEDHPIWEVAECERCDAAGYDYSLSPGDSGWQSYTLTEAEVEMYEGGDEDVSELMADLRARYGPVSGGGAGSTTVYHPDGYVVGIFGGQALLSAD